MKIGLEYGLEELYTQLLKKGYNVTYDVSQSDVYIYQASLYEGLLNQMDSFEDKVFIINANNKTIEEIENIILEKRYSALF
ncbi:uncharacterized protein UPF0180 [Natranaerovirga hydrolytica]|uniref:Uncharacterized protein UPF0180 n=1 Tax=Natranaerovirga hydrolytica TaxID=680378 RepID=A0A4R1MAI4_9FIRM|nr:YkuS family protein [Natranaerovirga hydrolytica]TCK86773.1 uncharacterized protein UPF0180 [Natranaerovirga hydrolytica]